MRKTVAALILVPLAIIIIALAVANRAAVTVSLDPFGGTPPAAAVTQPLFVVILAVLIFGVLIGGVASWLGQAKWRRMARWLERENATLRAELAPHRVKAEPTIVPEPAPPPPRLKLKPPAH